MYGTEHARDAQRRSPLLVISSYIKLKETQLIFFPQACTHESRFTHTTNVLFSYVP